MNRLDRWSWDGKIDRGTYAIVGLVGFGLKHNLDRLVAARVFHRPWSLFNYRIPLDRAVRISSLGSSDRAFLFWMWMLSLPFIWVGLGVFRQIKQLSEVSYMEDLTARGQKP